MNFRRLAVRALFALKTRLELYEEIRDFLEEQIPLVACLRELHDNAQTRKELEYIVTAQVLRDLLRNLDAGRKLSDCMGNWVPQEELQLIAAGERVGDLAMGFREAALIASQRAEMRGELVKSLAYPTVLLNTLAGFLAYFGFFLIPELSKFLPPEKWKGAAHLFYQIVHFFTAYSAPLIAAAIIVIAGAYVSLPRWTGAMRRHADKFLPWNLYRTYNSSTFLVALAAMLRAGIPFDSAVRTVALTANPWMAFHLRRVSSRIRAGQQPERALDTGLFEDKVAFQLKARGKLSSFERAIESIGRRTTVYAMKRMRTISAGLSFVVMIMVAGMAFWGYYTGTSVNQQIANETKMHR
jgi:type II secretory pathway component PulF